MSKQFNPQDHYFKKAQHQNYRARSVFKLEELDKKYKLIRPNEVILDVGAAPGSWLQYVSNKIGAQGKTLGLDLQEIEYIAPNVITEVCDVTDPDQVAGVLTKNNLLKFDLILSDVAPNTIGIPQVDHARSVEINKSVFELAKKYLKPGGRAVFKVFDGNEFAGLLRLLRTHFKKVEVTKVRATRQRSREVYAICS